MEATPETLAPIDLREKYGNTERGEKYRRLFNTYSTAFELDLRETNDTFGLKVGDHILFRNGYDIEFITEILGFSINDRAYLLWDCYWFTIDLKTRFISKIEKQ